MDNLKSVPLEAHWVSLGAKMVPFAGYSMPLQFEGIKAEHIAVRTQVGLFDVSHMGEVELRGPNALRSASKLFTNDIRKLQDGQAMYTAMCIEDGGIVDDLVVYRISEERIFVCVNASNREKDFEHMRTHAGFDTEVLDVSEDWAQLALQGPNSVALLSELTDFDLNSIPFYRAAFGDVAGVGGVLISRTGYTGEDGFELYIPSESA